MHIIDALKWRYATQKFDTNKDIPEETLTEILTAGNLAATAYGLQPFEMMVVKDRVIKERLIPASYGQEHAGYNSALIVFATRTDIDEAFIGEYVDRLADARQLPADVAEGIKNTMNGDLGNRTPENRAHWAANQAFIALGTVMAAASEAEVDNHAMLGFDPDQYDEILGLKEYNLHATVILALGYRAPDDAWQHYLKVRKDLEDIVKKI